MITTTVRFDRDTWASLGHHAERLEIAKAVLIRDATIIRLASIEANDSMLREHVGDTLLAFGMRLDKIERWIARGGR